MRALIAAAASVLSLAASGAAQDVTLQSRLADSLGSAARTAAALRLAFDDSVSRVRAGSDTLTVGPFRMLVPATRELAAAGARIAADSLRPLGDLVTTALHPYTFLIRRSTVPRWSDSRIAPVVVSVLDSGRNRRADFWEQSEDPRVIARFLLNHARALVTQRLDGEVAQWMHGRSDGIPPLLFDSVPAFAWQQHRLSLVSSSDEVERRCYDGNMADCRHVLGFDTIREPLRGDGWSPTMYTRYRVALVQLAIQLGGDGAVQRLFTSEGTPEQRIARIAGVPADSVVRAWHSRVRTVRLPSENLSAGMAVTSLGWIGLLGFLALRNSRWR